MIALVSRLPFLDVGFLANGRYQKHNATIVDLIKTAWNIDGESVSGGPTWLDTDRFDVIAKAPPKTTETDRALRTPADGPVQAEGPQRPEGTDGLRDDLEPISPVSKAPTRLL